MKKYNSTILLFVFALFFGISSMHAQVEFKIERMGATNSFLVSAISNETYDNPKNIISTAQVTLLTTAGNFQVDKIVNLYPNAKWRVNGRSNTPKENISKDYLYFGLENLGTNALKFKKGEETPLFLIQAKTCEGEISLMDNSKDPFMFPNSRQVNVGNQITILGAGGDAFSGNVKGKNAAECLKINTPDLIPNTIRILPNVTQPAVVKVEFNRGEKDSETGKIVIYDSSARSMYFQDIVAKKGYNIVEVDLTRFPNGIYFLTLNDIAAQPLVERLVVSE